MTELYDYFVERHPNLEIKISKTVELNAYELWIKFNNDTILVYDVDLDDLKRPTFGQTLKAILKRKHLTQKSLAIRLNVEPNFISELVNDRIKPDKMLLKEIRRVLGEAADDLKITQN